MMISLRPRSDRSEINRDMGGVSSDCPNGQTGVGIQCYIEVEQRNRKDEEP